MKLTTQTVLVLALAALTVSGCQSSRFGSLDSRSPAPLTAAPSGSVQSSQLPPPQQPSGPTGPNSFPTVPGTETAADPAASAEAFETAAAAAPEITAGSVAGVWNAEVGGQSCRVATPQTKFGQGFRAGPLRCPPPLDGVKSWNVAGKQLSLYDEGGGVLARLYSSSAERFDGQTTSGQPISLSR